VLPPLESKNGSIGVPCVHRRLGFPARSNDIPDHLIQLPILGVFA
jgi:hypothetical protein